MRSSLTVMASVSCLLLAGCAADGGNLLTTASIPQQQAAAAPAVDPACLALQNRIALLRAEGTIGRVEKAAEGKTKTVVIKRAALAKVTELNQANADFRSRCSNLRLQTAAAPVQQAGSVQQAAVSAPKPSEATFADAMTPQE